MKVLIVLNTVLPVTAYGGTERVVWYLAHELQKKGHDVYLLAAAGSTCPFATCLEFDSTRHIDEQIPEYVDVVHFHNTTMGYAGEKPYIVTYHGNYIKDIDRNAVFVSKNHAERNHAVSFVHNGLDWDDYGISNVKIGGVKSISTSSARLHGRSRMCAEPSPWLMRCHMPGCSYWAARG